MAFLALLTGTQPAALFGDGSVRFLKNSINHQDVYWALSTRDGGEVVGQDHY